MKNLLIYTRSDARFSTEVKTLAKIQIDNSLDLGWKKEDILLYTNFPYEYNGVKSRIIPNLCYEPDRTNKIPVIKYLFDNDLIVDDIYWYHDFDAFQEKPFDLTLKSDLALTPYGYKKQWNCGSFFFTKRAKDIFTYWNNKITPRKRADEKALTDLIASFNFPFQYETLDIGYNYGQRLTEFNKYDYVDIKVLHFHPYYRYYKSPFNNLEIFMYGSNRLGHPIMSERLIKIFKKNGIE